jgi:hypothetical protein
MLAPVRTGSLLETTESPGTFLKVDVDDDPAS